MLTWKNAFLMVSVMWITMDIVQNYPLKSSEKIVTVIGAIAMAVMKFVWNGTSLQYLFYANSYDEIVLW